MKSKCILFIPVSSTSGIGEYARSLIIANEIKKQQPTIDIHFVLNSEVSYFSSCPYSVHPCQGSATKDIDGVNNIIKNLKPDLVIFDASGRSQQIKQAKKIGAKVAFISQHKSKRSRGLKLNRLFNIDKHWVVQPSFCIQPLGKFQMLKLSLFKKVPPKNVGAVFSSNIESSKLEVLRRFNLRENDFFIFNAGSGGHKTSKELCADLYYQAAKLFYQQMNITCVMVFGDNYPKNIPDSSQNDDNKNFICIRSLTNSEFIALLVMAKGRVISAGDTILQCIDLNKVSAAAAVSKDQPKRLADCVEQELILEAKLTVESLYQQAKCLLDNKKNEIIINNMKKLESLDALNIISNDIRKLLTDL